MAQPSDLAQIMQIQSKERLARAEKRKQAQREAEKAKRKRPGKSSRASSPINYISGQTM